jgi:hypothetical protein
MSCLVMATLEKRKRTEASNTFDSKKTVFKAKRDNKKIIFRSEANTLDRKKIIFEAKRTH